MASITIKNLVKTYGNVTVIPDLNLEIADREFVVFVGPSGCGKSTLLRIIAGLEPITAGEVFIGDTRVNGVPAARRNIAMVFQDYALYPHMSFYDNMAFALELRNVPKAEIDRLVGEAAGILGLSALLDRYPRQLSGGQRQRVAMGRAIVRNPQVFLFDEPLSNLDAKLRVQMRTEIKLLHQRLKTTSIYVTHDQVEAMTMADQIVVMRDGRVEQAGAPLELYDNPANVFVAGFIGSPAMNFIDGTVADGGVRAGDGTLLPLPTGAKVETGKRVRYGVRPSHLRVAADGAGLPTEVEVVEPTGDDTFVYGRMAGQEICAMFNERQHFGPGDVIRLQPDVGRIHLFDADTERRL